MRMLLYPLRWLRAVLGGYFWLPCPVCGKKFGGFESEFPPDGSPLWGRPKEVPCFPGGYCYISMGRCICKWCAKELKNRSETEKSQ